MDITLIALLAALGALTGFAAGLLGIGGGMLLTPFLTLILSHQGFPAEHVVHVAIATSLATILFTSISSVRAHHKRGAVLWHVAFAISPGILVGSLLGAQVASRMPTFWIAAIFAGFVSFSALQMLRDRKPKPSRQLPGTVGMLGAGGVIGAISSFVGAGGGFISVPFMVWCNVKIHNAVATSAALGFPIAAAGTVGYVISGWNTPGLPGLPQTLGFVYLPALVSVAAISVLTAPLGAKVAHSMDTKPLKRIFAWMLFILSGYMLYRAVLAY